MTADPEASILINNFNYGRFVGEAVESALGQVDTSVEVIVVDDGSTDDSLDVLASFGDRITVVAKPNGGQASSFNAGMVHAGGEVVMFLDADDRFRPGKARAVCDALSDNDLGWCFHPLRYVDIDGTPTAIGPPAMPAGRYDVRERVRRGEPPGFVPAATTGLAFRATLLRRILPMPEELRITADNYVKAVAIGLSPGVLLEEQLAEQRLHGGNAYTGLEPASARRVASELDIAHAIYVRWPELRRYAIARGMGALRLARGLDEPEVREAVTRFIDPTGARTRLRIRIHRAVWWARGD